jgi:hypothetical protein
VSGQFAEPAGRGSASRIAVIGDVGGHLDELRSELVRLGADARTGTLPDELTVIQVGDLIHRGPDSAGVVAVVDRYLREQPDQWVQLVGNHEAQYLAAPTFAWPERLDDTSAATIREWWSAGRLLVAAVVSGVGEEKILITHAGLTSGFWRGVLGAPDGAQRTADVLNAMIGHQDDLIFRAGQMLGGGPADTTAGPLWASAATELVPGWLSGVLPFSQIHGHTSLYAWQEGRFLARAEIVRRTTIDLEARHETTRLGGGRIIGIDPGHDRHVRHTWRAWEVSGNLGAQLGIQPADGSPR